MTHLRLINVTAAGAPAVTAEVAAGEWVTLTHAEPQRLLAAVAGETGPTDLQSGRVLLAGKDLTGRPVVERARAGLAVCSGRLPDLPGLRVLDVLMLARPQLRRGVVWRAGLGSKQARAALVEEEADARTLAGRLGIGAWLDVPAVGLPAPVVLAADLTRAVAGAPQALVWAVPVADADPHTVPRPDEPAVAVLAEALAGEQSRLGMAVVAVEPAGAR